MERTGTGTDAQGRAFDYAEDALGFGRAEFHTARDLLLRPREVLDAYLDRGSTGGARYARPLRFYVALNGVLMFYLFLAGGSEAMFAGTPPEMMDGLVAKSGKTRDAFMGDLDGWMSVALIPISSAVYALCFAPLVKRWLRGGWRPAFRATFALMGAATLPFLALGPLQYAPALQPVPLLGFVALLLLNFARMGRGRLWRTPLDALGKGVLLVLALLVGMTVATPLMIGVGVLGGLYGS